MKIKATKKGYYGGKIRKIGEIFEYSEEKEIPAWATLVDGIETRKNKKSPKISKEADDNLSVKSDKQSSDTDASQEETVTDTAKVMTDTEKQQYLELLINEGIEKNILVEDADKKTVDEQIAELEKALRE